ncbi:MAG: hypothetical protein HYX24_05865 [Candidatus Aenigmarchaeota archaeon]|nr:hypothetical protein [Candidatus Aenigmarchaeota archaeon]
MLLKFSAYLREEKVRKVSPDISEAKGLLKSGMEDLEIIRTKFELTESTASILFKNTYDAIRSVLQAFLSKEGYTPYSHEAIIAFSLERGNIAVGEAVKLDKFRQLRNDVSYRAARATSIEAKEIQMLAGQIIERLKNKL